MGSLKVPGPDRYRPYVSPVASQYLELAAFSRASDPAAESRRALKSADALSREPAVGTPRRRDNCPLVPLRFARVARVAQRPALWDVEHFPQEVVDGVRLGRDDLDVIDSVHVELLSGRRLITSRREDVVGVMMADMKTLDPDVKAR
jgi:hypothetical protein